MYQKLFPLFQSSVGQWAIALNPPDFLPPSPFTLSEFDADGKMPERVYDKQELLSYLRHCRQKCRTLVLAMTDEVASRRWINPYKNFSVLEILLYNMRHVQHHAAQLNLLLRQGIDDAPGWVSQANDNRQ